MGFNNWFGGVLMKEYLNATRLVTKLKMLRSGKKTKSFMLVEGITDLRLYSKFIEHTTCEVLIADSKQNVISCITACNKEQLQGIVGIVDADFWWLEEEQPVPPNLFITDEHDLECMLVHSPAYENILIEYGDPNKEARFEGRTQMCAKTLLLESAAQIGYLRWYSLKNNLGLRFSQLDFSLFVNQSNLEVNLVQFITEVLIHSKKKNILKPHHIAKEIQLLRSERYSLWNVCCGHDIIEILTMGLVHIFGDYNAKTLFPGQLEGSFRLAYTYSYFKESKLYAALRLWEEENAPYSILK